MSDLAYHIEELRIALSPNDPRRILPPVHAGHRRVLDVGCGAGQTLAAGVAAEGRECFGIDIDHSALALGRTFSSELRLACGSGEALPFRSASFDLVISRVSLPFMHVAAALGEMARVLRPGGEVWLTLHPVTMPIAQLWHALRRGQFKNAAFRSFVIANGVAMHLTGHQFRAPAGRIRWESFQTRYSITRALRRAGFGRISVVRDGHFVATGVRG